ncbi:protein PMR5 [Magnolia sinica]|uniref:protein PMR5 n=1 Tax=Magnolia sinica TaxID=86752 RepID=UPI0026585CB1|nr:protein PMR5 [Magnolia sinica]
MASSPSFPLVGIVLVLSLLYLVLLVLLEANVASSALLASLHHHHQFHKRKPSLQTNGTKCDLYTGSWVRDTSYPLYQYSSCPIIDAEFNCQMYGRPDSDYQRFRWKPTNCELPRFDGVAFLLRMRGKKVMFVGDSLGRNQWESLICMIYASVSQSQTQLIRGEPLSTFNFLDYGVSILFYRAPYLVDIDIVQGKRILKLDEIDENANMWKGVDVLSFNSGHWWTHVGGLQGWDYIQQGGAYFSNMDRLAAFDSGMTTWAKWVDANVDTTKTRVFFQAISPTHYDPSEWSSPVSKNCYGETEPVSGWIYAGAYPDQMRVVRAVLREMSNPTYLLDITTLSALRKDAHPSIYSGDLGPQQRANPDRSADCSHWCLPGLPDTWNQLFYTALFF